MKNMETILDAVKQAGGKADYIDVRIEETESTTISVKGEDIENISQPIVRGGTVRAFCQGGWGYVSFALNLQNANIEDYIASAVSSARLLGRKGGKLASVPVVEDKVYADLKKDPRKVLLEEKVSLIASYNKILLSLPDMQSTQFTYLDRMKKKYFASSEGASVYQEQPRIILGVSAVARKLDNVQAVGQNFYSIDSYAGLENLDNEVLNLGEKAGELLIAPPAKSSVGTVVLGPAMSGLFAHEAFGHLSEGDFIYENESLQEVMQLGRRFGGDLLSIVDDPALPQYGYYLYDDEGVRSQKKYLIKNGLLHSRLHNRETSKKMGERGAGNARAVGYDNPPLVRMSNTYIEPGESSLEELVADVDNGILTHKWLGGNTDREMFTFTAGWGQIIENGELGELVRDVKLTGNVFTTLQNIDGVSKGLRWEPGYCGKGGQGGLPTATGGPFVRVRGVKIGGK